MTNYTWICCCDGPDAVDCSVTISSNGAVRLQQIYITFEPIYQNGWTYTTKGYGYDCACVPSLGCGSWTSGTQALVETGDNTRTFDIDFICCQVDESDPSGYSCCGDVSGLGDCSTYCETVLGTDSVYGEMISQQYTTGALRFGIKRQDDGSGNYYKHKWQLEEVPEQLSSAIDLLKCWTGRFFSIAPQYDSGAADQPCDYATSKCQVETTGGFDDDPYCFEVRRDCSTGGSGYPTCAFEIEFKCPGESSYSYMDWNGEVSSSTRTSVNLDNSLFWCFVTGTPNIQTSGYWLEDNGASASVCWGGLEPPDDRIGHLPWRVSVLYYGKRSGDYINYYPAAAWQSYPVNWTPSGTYDVHRGPELGLGATVNESGVTATSFSVKYTDTSW